MLHLNKNSPFYNPHNNKTVVNDAKTSVWIWYKKQDFTSCKMHSHKIYININGTKSIFILVDLTGITVMKFQQNESSTNETCSQVCCSIGCNEDSVSSLWCAVPNPFALDFLGQWTKLNGMAWQIVYRYYLCHFVSFCIF